MEEELWVGLFEKTFAPRVAQPLESRTSLYAPGPSQQGSRSRAAYRYRIRLPPAIAVEHGKNARGMVAADQVGVAVVEPTRTLSQAGLRPGGGRKPLPPCSQRIRGARA